MKMYAAVITADIVNSTKLGEDVEKELIKKLKSLLAPYKSEFFRGDSFQVYLKEAEEALQVLLLCRTAAIGISDTETLGDVRCSLGIGSVMPPIRALGSARGEAFLLSGRSFDALPKAGRRLKISIDHDLAQTAVDILSDYLDAIYQQMSPKQAAVIMELLLGRSQQEAAEKLGRSKSTVNQHVSAGRWEEIDNLLSKYRLILEQVKKQETQEKLQ